ncbi:MAG: helix-turn-helix domain-containing protein [Acidimicrobiales bacterium]
MTIATTTHSNPSRTIPTPPLAVSERLVFTVAEAGELLGISRAFAYELVARGELPVIRLGRRRLIPKRALLELVGMDTAANSGSDPVTRLVDGSGSDVPSIAHPASLRTIR